MVIAMTNILIIEDNLEIVQNLRILLEDEGFKVYSVMTREAALQEIEHNVFDLILLDLTLPDGNGYSLCTAIKRKGETPVIFLTAMDDEASGEYIVYFDSDYRGQALETLAAGTEVKIWFSGQIAESYPMQIVAYEIEIK